jgi:dTDP-4-amino-4,6-dideoxygalactose transaminase
MKVPLLDLAEQHRQLRPELDEAVARVLDTNAFILGGEVAELEREIADYCQAKFAIGCASGSDAILLALLALGIGPGDEVITTPYSFFATVSSITRLGATPVFVDIEPDTFNIDPSGIETRISPKTKAIEPVHLYGQCSDMGAINAIAEGRGISVVEDAAQAIGAEYHGRRAGSMSAVGCISFYPSKNLGGLGDGGMMTTSDDGLNRKLLGLRNHGAEERYYHKYVGLNSRLDGFQGATLRVKLPHLDEWTEKRRANAACYRQLFTNAGLTEQVVLPVQREGCRHIYNQYVIRVPHGRRDGLRSHLLEHGVGTDVYYPVPLHLQECFAYLGYGVGDLPEAEKAAEETLALPIYPELEPEQQEYVVDSIASFIQ